MGAAERRRRMTVQNIKSVQLDLKKPMINFDMIRCHQCLAVPLRPCRFITGLPSANRLASLQAEQVSYAQLLDVAIIVIMAVIWALMPTDGFAIVTQWFHNKVVQVSRKVASGWVVRWTKLRRRVWPALKVTDAYRRTNSAVATLETNVDGTKRAIRLEPACCSLRNILRHRVALPWYVFTIVRARAHRFEPWYNESFWYNKMVYVSYIVEMEAVNANNKKKYLP